MSWDKTKQKWKAEIYFDGKSKNIGSYDDETEAARACDSLSCGVLRSKSVAGT